MEKTATLLFFFWGMSASLFSQQVDINEPPVVARMMERWSEINRDEARTEGWRVQLVSTTDCKKVEEEKTLFLTRYPEIPADWVQEKPYYKLRAGAFFTKMEAISLQKDIETDYPGAYPAKDRAIRPADFLDMKN